MFRAVLALALLLATPSPATPDAGDCFTDSCVGCIDDCTQPLED